jgi:hypothetical protein
MKKLMPFILMAVFWGGMLWATDFNFDVKILNKEEVAKLSDEVLLDTYLNAVVEIDAVKEIHRTAGYTPKEYDAFKELLRYRILLIQEMQKRKIEIPPV